MWSFGPEAYEAFQILVAVLAIIVAPEALWNLLDRVRAKVLADCQPLSPSSFSPTTGWRITLRNRSRRFSDFEVFIFAAGQGNRLTSRKVKTANDGGLSFTHHLDETGCLGLHFGRFHRSREVRLNVKFAERDIPAFFSPLGRVHLRISGFEELLKKNPALRMRLVHHRVYLILLVFVGMIALIVARLLYFGLVG